MKKRDKFIAGTIVGGAVGSILAIMFAPKSGKETRADIKASSQKLYQQGSTFTEEFKKSSKSLWQTIKQWRPGKK
ncbi:YtxH domain-containing protein [Candidatus Gracilibacteria bacterium]|jgi:gas vesicle protein|nr:YtxH domain-containing protein [Candidatus Gracilibacteria bacterium]